jgi:AcrR family transcriptional regulator
VPRAGLSTTAVVDAALAIVDEQGADALTLAAVAGRFGVATPSLYKHVRGLDALQQKLSAAATTQLAQVLMTAAAGKAGSDALGACAAAYRSYAQRYPGRYPATQRVPDPADPAHVDAGERAVQTLFAVLAGYGLAGDNLLDATRIMRSALHGFVSLELSGGFGSPHDINITFDRLVGSLDIAFRHWGSQQA